MSLAFPTVNTADLHTIEQRWMAILPASASVVSFASAAALFSAVILGRWVVVATNVRAAQAQQLQFGVENEDFTKDERLKENIRILAEEVHVGKERMQNLRRAVLGYALAIFFSLIGALLQGLSVFSSVLTEVAIPFLLVATVTFFGGTFFAVIELKEAVHPEEHKAMSLMKLEREHPLPMASS